MKKKIFGFLVCMLMIISGFGTVFSAGNAINKEKSEDAEVEDLSSNLDLSIDYFITAEDHPDVLDDSSIDNIGYIRLHSGKDIEISSVKIFITNNKKDFLRAKIVEKGIWKVGEKITIQEIYPDEVKASFYTIMVTTAEEIHPLAEHLVCIDNAPIETYNFFDRSKDRGQTYVSDLTPGEYKTSSCYDTDWLTGYTMAAASLAVEYEGMDWTSIEDIEMWEYMFRVDAVCSMGDLNIQGFEQLKLIVDRPGSWGQGYGGKGSWNFDEGNEDHIGDWVNFVCKEAISVIEIIPAISFFYDWVELSEALRDNPDIVWRTNEWYPWNWPQDGSGCAYFFVYVEPDTTWEVRFNIGANYGGLGGPYMDLNPDSNHGQGIIVFGETSPPKQNSPPRTPDKPEGPTDGRTSKSYKYSVIAYGDPDNEDIKLGWDWNGDSTVDEWSDWLPGGYYSTTHSWSEPGVYYVKVKAKDDEGAMSEWSPTLTVEIFNNRKPNKPTISGTTNGLIDTEYEYTIVSTDPDDDDITYHVDFEYGSSWGPWGPVPSGTEFTPENSWSSKGTYDITAYVIDTEGAKSDTATLTVTMSKSKAISTPLFLQFLQNFFKRYPNTFPIIQTILQQSRI